jgi:hypothetical protein
MGWVVAALLFDLGLEDVYLTAVQKDGDNTLLYATTGIRRMTKRRTESWN